MSRKLSSLICASVASLCLLCCGASAQAQSTYTNNSCRCCTMNLATERDDCDYACAGYTCRGWYHRNFGPDYCLANCDGGYVPTIGPISCYCKLWGRRKATNSAACPTLTTANVPACYTTAPGTVAPTPVTAAPLSPTPVNPEQPPKPVN